MYSVGHLQHALVDENKLLGTLAQYQCLACNLSVVLSIRDHDKAKLVLVPARTGVNAKTKMKISFTRAPGAVNNDSGLRSWRSSYAEPEPDRAIQHVLSHSHANWNRLPTAVPAATRPLTCWC